MTAKTVRLAEVCRQDRISVRSGEEAELKYIGLEAIETKTGMFLEGELSKTPEVPLANSFRFNRSHVLYGKLRPYLNKVAVPDFEGKCSTEIIPLLPNSYLDRRYLAYFLRSTETVARISEKTAGSRMPRADMHFVLSLEIPLPPLAEQQRIVDLLSHAEGIVRLRREAQKKAGAIIPALFLDMFGDAAANPEEWSVTRLGTVVEEFRYGTSQKSGSHGFPTLRIPNVVGNRLDPGNMKLVAVPEAEANRIRLCDGDILFVRTNGNPDYVGRSAVYESEVIQKAGYDGDNCLYASYLIRARPSLKTVNPFFLQAFLSSSEGRKRLREQARTSAGQYNINTQGLGSVEIPLPPLKHQLEFERKSRQILNLQELQASSSLTAVKTFNALLARVFMSANVAESVAEESLNIA